MKIEYILLWSLSCLVVYTDAAEVANISHTSQGSPDFYLGDEVTFTCAAAGFSDIEYISLVYNDPGTASAGCTYRAAITKWSTIGSPFIAGVDGLDSPQLTPAYCVSVGEAEGSSLSVKVTITDVAVTGKFFCTVFDGTNNAASRDVYVTSVKVAPANLTMSVPEDVVEGKEFEMKCESTGGDPVSSYRYEIQRGSGSTPVAVSSPYIPNKADRGGFTITCTDTAHPNWKGGNTMMTSKEVLPKYIDAVEDTNLTPKFNPDYKNPLDCSGLVTGHPVPGNFSWTRNDIKLVEASGALNLTTTSGVTDGTEETVTCVARNGLGKNVTITWNVTWSSDVTTTPTTTDSGATSPAPNVGAIVGGVVGGGVGVAGIIMIVVVVLKKRAVPKAQAPQRPIDDPIIYADLVHDSPSKKVPGQGDREKKTI